jgi:hypothetical protein
VVGFRLWVFWVLLLLVFSFSFLVVLVYTPCVRRGALRFLFIYMLLTYQKKNSLSTTRLFSTQLELNEYPPDLSKKLTYDMSITLAGITHVMSKRVKRALLESHVTLHCRRR